MSYCEKIKNKIEKCNGTSCTWILAIAGKSVSLPLQGHNRSTEKRHNDEKIYRATPRGRIRQTRSPQLREETL